VSDTTVPPARAAGEAQVSGETSEESRAIKVHYQRRFAEYGAGYQAVQYSSRETQAARFSVLAQIVEKQDRIIDLGCGLGDLLAWLRRERGFAGEYLGLDLVPEFIAQARKDFASDGRASFRELDVASEALPSGYDVVVQSGMFNNVMKDNWGFLTRTVAKMYGAARQRVAFNALSTYVDYSDPGLFYANPLLVFDYCRRELGARVDLIHAYQIKPNTIPFEFTLYLYK
jgi:SAM-dependent methyltransferase